MCVDGIRRRQRGRSCAVASLPSCFRTRASAPPPPPPSAPPSECIRSRQVLHFFSPHPTCPASSSTPPPSFPRPPSIPSGNSSCEPSASKSVTCVCMGMCVHACARVCVCTHFLVPPLLPLPFSLTPALNPPIAAAAAAAAAVATSPNHRS